MDDQHTLQSGQSSRSMLKSGIEAAKAGRRSEAYQALRQVVAAEPSNQAAWLWLAGLTDDPQEALAILDRVKQLNPNHPKLEAAREWAQKRSGTAGARPAQVGPPQSGLAMPRDEQSGPPAPAVGNLWAISTLPSIKPQHLWAALGSLGLLVVMCILIWALWVQVDAVEARLPGSLSSGNLDRLAALQPELNAALSESRWEDAIAVLQVMRALDAESPTLKQQLAWVYHQLALQRRDQGDLEGAVAALDDSLAVVPTDILVQKERRLADTYRQGVVYHQAGDWQNAIKTLSLVQLEDPAYLDLAELLYSAHYNLGLAQQAASDLVGAQASYRAAVDLLPDEPLARDKAAEVALLLQPPTPIPVPAPTPTPAGGPQRILVDVSEQRMYVYEGDDLKWKWIISTGEPGRDTAIGNFKIQSKIPMAYASTWNLDMPHWLGIYWSGPLENGIHALPIKRDTGYKLWDGFLGQRVSYGCVILSDEDAETLFNWVDMGTPVIIQP